MRVEILLGLLLVIWHFKTNLFLQHSFINSLDLYITRLSFCYSFSLNLIDMQLKSFNIFLVLYLLFNANPCIAQYTPYFKNYSLSEYNAGNQNWGISKSNAGKLYVANNKGLLEFDSFKWNLFELPNKTTIRSVLAHEDRIYIGSYEEFGYWKHNKKGVLEYISLSSKLDENEFLNEEFWEIVPHDGAIIFRSFLNIYIYKDDEIKKIRPASTVISCDAVNEKLYVSTLRNGIFVLKNNTLSNVIDNDVLKETKVISIVEFENKLLISTSLKGCFIYDNKELIPWNAEINSLVKQHQLNSFTKLENGTMIFGTIQNGVYYTDSIGRIIFHINKENGLANNTVLSQYLDVNNELWLGLDNGLTTIDLLGDYLFYNDISGSLGAVYDVASYRGTVYIASNTGLYFLDKQNNLQFIDDSQGQVWDLKEINGELFCGHNNGTYLIKNNRLELISSYTGGWVIKKVPEKSNIYIQGTYAGLVRFKQNGHGWDVKHMGKTTDPIRFLEFEDQFTAWVAQAYRGLFKVRFNENYDSIVSIKNYENKGLESNFNVRVYKIKNEICFKTNTGWLRYEPLLDSIVSYDLLDETFGKEGYIISEENSNLLGVKKDESISFNSFSTASNNLFLPLKYFKNRLIVGYENLSKISDSIYALNLNDGFVLIDKNAETKKDSLYPVTIESVQINDERIDLGYSANIELPYSNSITISVSSPKSHGHFFEYAISEFDSKAAWNKMENQTLMLSNMNDGDYTLAFRTSDYTGDSSEIRKIKVVVLPPWYKGIAGFLLFVSFVVLSLLIAFYFHKRKIFKEQKVLQLRFELEQKALLKEKTAENDKKIIQLRNEALKSEVKLKSKQLANTAMALVKKNESMLEIKKELVQNKSGFDNLYAFRKLVKKIDNSIGHEDEWELFEYNFNQVHEEFFNELKAKFPVLTHKDLKICAYIKMNLSTKEIAPLMNISIRGVETHRYRLKRKLNLENDNSLTDYLKNFK